MNPIFEQLVGNLVSAEEPATCSADTCLADVIAKMRSQKVGAMVITRDGGIIEGIFTERDVLNKVDLTMDQKTTPVSQLMVKNPICLMADDPVRKAIVLMRVGKFRNLPVADREKKLHFVISVRDIVNYVADSFALTAS